MMEEIGKRTLAKPVEKVKIVPAALGDDTGLIGACGLIAQSLGF